MTIIDAATIELAGKIHDAKLAAGRQLRELSALGLRLRQMPKSRQAFETLLRRRIQAVQEQRTAAYERARHLDELLVSLSAVRDEEADEVYGVIETASRYSCTVEEAEEAARRVDGVTGRLAGEGDVSAEQPADEGTPVEAPEDVREQPDATVGADEQPAAPTQVDGDPGVAAAFEPAVEQQQEEVADPPPATVVTSVTSADIPPQPTAPPQPSDLPATPPPPVPGEQDPF